MSNIVRAVRNHREIARTRRAVNQAISQAATPGMRDELILIAQRQGGFDA